MEVTWGVSSSVAKKLTSLSAATFPSHRCGPLLIMYNSRDCMGTSILSKRGYRIEQAALCLINTPFSGNHAISMSYLLHLKAKQ